MNNVPAVDTAPWYFTAVVAAITAGAALIGSLVTAWITNREARKRLEADLGSRRQDERLSCSTIVEWGSTQALLSFLTA